MFADAIASEFYKLWRNRSTWFWGFCFAPLIALALGLGADYFMAKFKQGPMLSVDMANSTVNAVAGAASPLTLLFVLIAAAVLFAGEYRWETWRLLAPRNSRLNLMLAKLGVFAVGCVFTILAIALANLISVLAGSAMTHAAVTWTGTPGSSFILSLLKQFAITWAQLLQAGAVVALAAVLTRSILGSVMIPLVIGVVQAIVTGIPQPGADPMHPAVWRMLALPDLGVKFLRVFLDPGQAPQVTIDPGVAAQAAISLVGWIVIAFAVALTAFQRQDLAKE